MITHTTTDVGDGKTGEKGAGEPKAKNFKIWQATSSSDAGFMVTPDTAYMIGNKSNFMAVSSSGIALNSSGLSFNCQSENTRQGGLFIKMNDFIRMVPQTIVTPMPNQIPFPPIALPLEILKGLPFFLAMLI